MLAVLTRLMVGGTPERRESPAPGYATFDQLMAAQREQTRALERIDVTFRDGLRDLRDTLRAEWSAWRVEHEAHSAARDAAIAELRAWRRDEEIADAVKSGRTAMLMLAFRWATEHWQFVAAVLVFVLSLVWSVTGTGPITIDQVRLP